MHPSPNEIPKMNSPIKRVTKGLAPWLSALFVTALSFTFNIREARAAHAMGGEIIYEYLGNGDFFISLVFYRECFGN